MFDNTEKKLVIITGASRGIGKAIALEFAKEKYTIVVNYKNDEKGAEEVVGSIINTGVEAILVKADISLSFEVNRMVSEILNKYNKIDVLINNAGIIDDSLIVNMAEEKWDKVINTNLKGVFLCCRAVAKSMIRDKKGNIINISSISGVRGNIGQSNYSASKAAVLGLTKSLAKELGRYNICVNAILPGYHRTDLTIDSERKAKLYSPAMIAKEESVLSNFSDLSEVSKFIVFLAKSKSISGQIFNLDSRII